MDLEKIGQFLSVLRKEKNLTQEQLGQMLGTTNKTVSRWENGNYLPPAEMLKGLSEVYGVSINEILSGERLAAEEYQEKAEENIRSALESSSFTLDEKMRYYKRKWRREHLPSTILVMLVFFGCYWYALMDQRGWNAVVLIGMFVYGLWRRNQMMIYVEDHVYGQPGENNSGKKDPARFRRYIRVILLAALAVSILVLADLGDNLLYSMIPELNDGITIRGSFSRLFFGDDGWSREEYFRTFSKVLRLTGWLGAGNLILACAEKLKS